MRRDQAIFWQSGLFLTAQHLQQQSLFHQTQVGRLWRARGDHNWGVLSLEIRHDLLTTGILEIDECTLITRDGLYLSAGTAAREVNAQVPVVTIDRNLAQSSTPIRVALALARHAPRMPALAPADKDAGGAYRWQPREEDVPDLYDPNIQPTGINFLDYTLGVVFSRASSFKEFAAEYNGCELFPVGELVPHERGFRLIDRIIPPCLHLGASRRAVELVDGIKARLLVRALEYADLKREQGQSAAIASLKEVMRTLILTSLNRCYGDLAGVAVPWAHPYDIYACLCRIAGELSAFSEAFSVTGTTSKGNGRDGFPPYDHTEIQYGLEFMIGRIDIILTRLAGSDDSIPLELQGDLLTNRTLIPESFFKGEQCRYYLVIESDLQGKQLEQALFETGKLSSPGDMPSLRRAHLFGLPVQYMALPPEELPQRSNQFTYFSIDTSTQHWRSVVQERAIALFSTALIERGAKVRLVRTGGE